MLRAGTFLFHQNAFRGVFSVPRKLRNIAGSAGFHLTLAIISMHKSNSIVMQAPKMAIFETAANLELWPKILPHYRYIRSLERGPDRNIVLMAAQRSGIPISWTSEQIVDRSTLEIHFHHLKAWTKGMHVVWTFSDTRDGVLVVISHDLRFRIRALAPIVDLVIGDFFIHNIANKTLRCMKAYVEARANNVAA
jgi:ribosome-associated toxin RatA of RatAB toxin-antitoxin module